MNDIYQKLNKIIETGEITALCTVVETFGSVPRHAGSKMLVFPNGHIQGTIGGGEVEERVIQVAKQAMKDGHPQFVDCSLMKSDNDAVGLCGGSMKIYIEPIIPNDKVIIIGAGHVGKSVAHLAKWLNFRVIVSDDREGICNENVIPDADAFLEMPMEEIPENIDINSNTYLIIVTNGADRDIKGLPALLRTDSKYIGVMGSMKRWQATYQGLIEAGVTEESILRIKTPIGMDIHAETPDEIAISIMAEIIQRRNIINKH
jgi:xanthine dehydrogenase accessory factor